MSTPAIQPQRPRPLADPALDALEGSGEELARRWAAALVLRMPADVLARLPLARFTADGARLCDHALRALQSDHELARLTGAQPGARADAAPALSLVELTGAGSPAAVAEATELLRAVLWGAVGVVLAELPARVLADAADRLAHVCAELAAAAMAARWPEEATGPPATVPLRSTARTGHDPVVLIDERTPTRESHRPPLEISIRDVRRGDGPTAWLAAISHRLERHAGGGEAFAVLVAEPVDVGPVEGERLAAAIERLLREVLRQAGVTSQGEGGSVVREAGGRCWLLAGGMDRRAAQSLAERLTAEACALRLADGSRLRLAVGASSCPEDGVLAAALAAQADVGLFAARAALRGALPAERPT